MARKPYYAIVNAKTESHHEIVAKGNTADFNMYTAYVMHIARILDINNRNDFALFYYTWFYDTERDFDEQLCNESLPESQLDTVNRDLYSKLLRHKPFGLYGYNLYLAKVINLDQDIIQVVDVVKPYQIWEKQNQYHTWLKHRDEYDVGDFSASQLTKLHWPKKNDLFDDSDTQFNFHKSANNSRYNSKQHYKHLEKGARNAAQKMKLAYDLPCMPKHIQNRGNNKTAWDIWEDRSKRKFRGMPRHSSWKEHRQEHQYDHRIVRPEGTFYYVKKD